MVHLYIGDGKGKTTAALGLAMRAAGCGKKVYLAQFLKPNEYREGEVAAFKQLRGAVKLERFDHQIHPIFVAPKAFNRRAVCASIQEAMVKAQGFLEKKRYDVVILDELLNALAARLCTAAAVKQLIRKAGSTELIITGRTAPSSLIGLADYVSFVKKIKHPFRKGVVARKGIEY